MWVPDGEVDFLAVWRAKRSASNARRGELRHSAPVPIHAEEAPLSSILRSCGEYHLTIRASGDVAAEIEIAGIDRLQRARRGLQFADACVSGDQE